MLITPHPLCGKIRAIPSKSDAHRAIICALLSRRRCRISPIILSDDISATIGAAKALGAECTIRETDSVAELIIDSSGALCTDSVTIDCCESGSTLRFMLPVAAALGASADFVGSGRLPQRPIGEFVPLFAEHSAVLSNDHLPLSLSGGLTAGEYKISGNVSSQYVTGLLLALPVLQGSSRITLTTPLQSRPYVDMTLDTMRRFGVTVKELPDGWVIPGGQQYRCDDYTIDGDWSQAAFFLAAGAIGGDIEMAGLRPDSVQGDKEIFRLTQRFGGNIRFENGALRCSVGSLHGIEIDASQIPDLVPALAVTAAFAKGDTRILGAARLRFKESDRIQTVAAALRCFGVSVTENDDGMIIHGGAAISPRRPIDCAGDHRIAMAFSVMGAYADGASELIGHECVSKSYPAYFRDFTSLQKGY